MAYGGNADTLRAYQHPARQMRRYICVRCGELVHGTNRFEMIAVPNARVMRAHGGTLPPELAPAMHLFYARRAFDVVDDLPKYLEGWDGPLA